MSKYCKDSSKVITGIVFATITAFASLGATNIQAATLVPSYMIIAKADGGLGDAFHSHDGEMGAINYIPGRASDPSNPKGVSAGYKSPIDGTIGLGGDIAVTSITGKISLERTDIHSTDTGYSNQGIDCAASFGICTPSELKDNQYNSNSPVAIFSAVSDGNGVQGGQVHTDLLSELDTLASNYWAMGSTGILDLSSDGKIEDVSSTNFFDTAYGSGLHVIDIDTGGFDMYVNNVTWRIDGEADTKVIFRVNSEANLKFSNANIYISDDMLMDSVLFLVDGKQGAASIDFSNTYFYGTSFWDHGGILGYADNYATFNDVIGCGQLISDRVNFNNVSMDGCTFNETPSVIPLPAAFPLFGAVLAAFGFFGWRKRVNT
ncbi:MAG: hypothetical protein JKY04_03355 [Sneathiella sp.]|nr:hypothetical protein [Sneathiella sp.]